MTDDKDYEAQAAESSRAHAAAEQERAAEFVSGIRERLGALAERRSFRFVNTRWEEAEEYLRHLTEFEGFDDSELRGLRLFIVGLFPHVFRAYLKQLGRARGELFAGSDADPERMSAYRRAAEELLAACGVESFLDDRSVVFLFHQGYSFSYFQADDIEIFDAPIFHYVEGEPGPKQTAPGFAELLDAELRLMEENNRLERQSGGYFVTLSGGYSRRLYPAQDEGPSPLETEDDLI